MAKIMSYPEVYSKKQGTIKRRICVERDLTIEQALNISFLKYGNKNRKFEWTYGGMLYPTTYRITGK